MKKTTLGLIISMMLLGSVAFAETSATVNSRNIKADGKVSMTAKKNVDISCVSAAVSVREDALLSAWSKFNTSVSATLSARKSALVSAWGLTDAKARKEAVKAAWSTANKSRREAASTYKSERKAAWTAFKTAARACGGTTGSEAALESGTSAAASVDI